MYAVPISNLKRHQKVSKPVDSQLNNSMSVQPYSDTMSIVKKVRSVQPLRIGLNGVGGWQPSGDPRGGGTHRTTFRVEILTRKLKNECGKANIFSAKDRFILCLSGPTARGVGTC